MSEPKEITAGLTVSWSASFPGYDSADGWAIKYHLSPAAGGTRIEIDATGDGETWSVSVDAATSAGYATGRYSWSAIASSGAIKKEAATGAIEILPDPTSGTAPDGRTHAEVVLDAIEAVIEKRASSSQAEIEIDGQKLKHMSNAELLQLRHNYAIEVGRERQTAGLAAGTGFGTKVQTRFGP